MKYYISIEQPGVEWEDTPQMSFTIETVSKTDLHQQAIDIANAVSEMHKSTVRLSKSAGYNNQGYYYNSEWK
jgi:hypothetical protein